MNIIILIFSMLLSSCSTPQKLSAFSLELKSKRDSHSTKYQACIAQEEEMGKVIFDKKDKKTKEIYESFPEDDGEALKAINNFDYSKTDHTSDMEYFNFYLSHCSDENFEAFQKFNNEGPRQCSGVFNEYKYFNGLIYGLSHYSWSALTKKTGRSLLAKYLNNIVAEKNSLTSILLALSLVKSSQDFGLIKKESKKEIETLVHLWETKRQELVTVFKVTPPKNCAEEKVYYESELRLASEAADDLKNILKKYF